LEENMLHAVIRSEGGAFHFIGEVTPYNLQTLRLHMRDRLHDGSGLRVCFEMDPEDQPAFARHAGKLLAKLRRAGNMVEVAVSGLPARAAAYAGRSRSSIGLAVAS
jgi:hypothetical protein